MSENRGAQSLDISLLTPFSFRATPVIKPSSLTNSIAIVSIFLENLNPSKIQLVFQEVVQLQQENHEQFQHKVCLSD